MRDVNKLSHVVYECKYHLVWCPKYRFRIMKGEVAKSIRDIVRQLCEWRKIEILECCRQIPQLNSKGIFFLSQIILSDYAKMEVMHK